MPRPPKTPPVETLDLLVERVGKLRDAGILEIEFEGVRMKLSPPSERGVDPAPDRTAAPVSDVHASPLEDPLTFGRAPGSTPPGFKRPTGDVS